MANDEYEIVYCSGCGIEIDQVVEGVMYLEKQHFCLWCWSNDCCRITKDAAESGEDRK